jgi:FkbM family methyltransferase
VIEGYVMDVGAHLGNDTARYLEQGHRVVAIEANPILAAHLEQRFAEEIANGRLTVIAAGVHYESGEMDFYVSEHPELSSFIRSRAMLGTATATRVKVPTRSFRELLDEYGVPGYLKVDIEGLDDVCIDALEPGRVPTFLSTEIDWSGAVTVRRLQSLGYRRFKLITQWCHRGVTLRRLATGDVHRQSHSPWPQSSGPFGDDAEGPWLSPTVAFATVSTLLARRAWQQRVLWHDLHATTNE